MASPIGYRHGVWALLFCSCAALAMTAQESAPATYRQ